MFPWNLLVHVPVEWGAPCFWKHILVQEGIYKALLGSVNAVVSRLLLSFTADSAPQKSEFQDSLDAPGAVY